MPTKTELRDKLCKLLEAEGVGSDVLAGELVDLIEERGVIRLEPEQPKLPKRLEVVRLAPEDWQRKRGWLAKVVVPGDLILAVVLDGWTAGPAELRVSLLEAAVAAYNERQEINEIEADVDNAISSGLAALCREEIDAEVQRGVQDERARCLAIMDWLLGSLPQGWDFARRFAKAARGKTASGAKQRGAGPARTGADDLPNPEPEPFAEEPEEAWPNLRAGRGFAGGYVITAAVPPPSVGVSRDLTEAEASEVIRRYSLGPFKWTEHDEQRFREMCGAAAAELNACRREVVDLRKRIERAKSYMRNQWPVTLASAEDGVILRLWRILTGKEY